MSKTKMKQSKQTKSLKLDLGCGMHKMKGYTGVDIVKKGTQAAIELDLLKYPWPWADNSVEAIHASHFLEHLPHIDSFNDHMFYFMNEVYRILKPGGIAQFRTPYYTSMRAFQDPTHHRFITEATFLYFDKEWRKINELEHYPITANLKVIKIDHSANQSVQGRASEAVQHMAQHEWNVIDDLIVVLQKPNDKSKS